MRAAGSETTSECYSAGLAPGSVKSDGRGGVIQWACTLLPLMEASRPDNQRCSSQKPSGAGTAAASPPCSHCRA